MHQVGDELGGVQPATLLGGPCCGSHHRFFNKRNIKYRPYGPWGHFPKEMFGTKPCTIDNDSSTSDCDSDFNSNSGSDSRLSLTSCSVDPLSSKPDYSPDDE